METGKPGLASAAAHMSSVAAQTERRMEVQAPLTALYIQTAPALPLQPMPQPPLAAVDPSALHLTMPPLYSKETLPFLTLHIANGLQPGLSMTATPPAAKPKSSGKHLCPHCGRDCMKPSVLEKHLRCHTGERPYPCTVCGVSFKTQSNLYKHKRTQAHARLSSESEQSTMDSLDSISSSTETTSLMDEQRDESAREEKEATLPAASKTPVVPQTLECNEKILSQREQEHAKPTQPDDKPTAERPPINRHVVLQRQEATLFSKQWESSVSNSKSQSHESTDSGFSESSDLYHSPGSLLPDHMESLSETTTEHGEKAVRQQESQEVTTKEQENKSLEERISKLISQNSAVVEDKHLENVRPRKTVLSKQGSIDLPMPYTYKDSFHFDMRISKMSNSNKKTGLYNSVPTQQSTSVEHAPLIRSNSLPFSVSLLQPDPSCPTTSSHHRDYTTLFRRGSSGHINPTSFSTESVNQQPSTHRPLVRQGAVDCNHATDTLFKNSSVDEACIGSLRCHGEAGDNCGETSSRKFRRKKAQKFAYNKWYMYGGGTFKKLYEMERAGENIAVKGAKSVPNPEVIHSLQKRLSAGHCETTVVSSPSLVRSATMHSLETHSTRLQLMPGLSFNSQPNHILASSTTQRMPLRRNLSLSVLPLSFLSLTPSVNLDPCKRSDASTLRNELSCSASQSHVNIPSDRKKQRTDDKLCSQDTETDLKSSTSHTCVIPQTHLSHINIQPNSAKVSLFSSGNAIAPPGINSSATSISSSVQSSFMPKYQLKLPNASDSPSSSLIQVGSKTAENGIVSTPVSSLTTPVSTFSDTSNATLQDNASKNCCSTPTKYKPCTASEMTVISPVVHQRPVADTKTTASLRNSHVGHFSTIIQSSSFGSAAPVTLSNTSVTFTPIHRTQSSPAAFTGFAPTQQQPTPQKCTPSLLTPQSNPEQNIPVIPCQNVPGQQTAPKVFHVQTADLQICFQIISDEQLALIEPQIEKQTDSSHSPATQASASENEVRMCTTPESIDKEISHRHCESNKEEGTLNQDMTKPSMCDKSEEEQPDVHMSQAPGQSPALSAHPHNSGHTNKVGKHSSSVGVVSTDASPKDTGLDKISQKDLALLCNIAQEEHSSHVKESMDESVSQALLEEHKPCQPANVTCPSHCPPNKGRINCNENCTKFGNEKNMSFLNSNKSVAGRNLQLSMVSLSLSQTNLPSEMGQPTDGPALSHVADLKQTASIASVSTEAPISAVSTNAKDHPSESTKGVFPAESVKLQSDTGAQPQNHKPLGTCTEGPTHMQLDNMRTEEASDRADSIPNCWPVGQQHPLHLSQTQSGMCGYPPRSSGMDPNLQSINKQFSNPEPTLLLKTNSNLPQHPDSGTGIHQVNQNKPPQSKSISNREVGRPDEVGLFPKQDQRQVGGAEAAIANCTTEFTSQSHVNDKTGTYQSNNSVFVNPPRQINAVYSEHMCQEEPLEPCDKFPSLFGVGNSFSYSPADPMSGAVRVVQSSMDAEDSSSDDEGKLIIEL